MKQTEYILHPHCVMISDLHVGSPLDDRLDDFNQDDTFERLLLETIPESLGGQPASLIIAGDFIDFPQVLPKLSRHEWGDKYGTTEDDSHVRIQRVIEGHPRVFSALGDFVARGGQVIFLPGNHDIDLIWPKVFNTLKQAMSAEEPQVCLVEEGYLFEKQIYIEHGNQYSFENKFMHWPRPILAAPDKRDRLERAWGTLFMDLIYNDIEYLNPFVNKLDLVNELIPIILRGIKDGSIPPKILARFVAFWLLRGKPVISEYFLGKETLQSDGLSGSAPRHLEMICSFIMEFDGETTAAQAVEVADETFALLDDLDSLPGEMAKHKRFVGEGLLGGQYVLQNDAEAEGVINVDGLLGRTNELGLRTRQLELLRTGYITIVAFGHTHKAIDGNELCIFGDADPRRAFNTGSWMPRLRSEDTRNMTWRDLIEKWPDLKARSLFHDVRYLIIETGNIPTGHLKKA